MHSFWMKDALQKRTFDGVIIGAGIAGLTTALLIKKRNPRMEIAVLEAGSRPVGASVRNAGFACFGSPGELLMDMEESGEEQVNARVFQRLEGLRMLYRLNRDDAFAESEPGGYELFLDQQQYKGVSEKLHFFNSWFES